MNKNFEVNKPDYDQIIDAIINILVDAGVTYQDADDIMYQIRKSLKCHKINREK